MRVSYLCCHARAILVLPCQARSNRRFFEVDPLSEDNQDLRRQLEERAEHHRQQMEECAVKHQREMYEQTELTAKYKTSHSDLHLVPALSKPIADQTRK